MFCFLFFSHVCSEENGLLAPSVWTSRRLRDFAHFPDDHSQQNRKEKRAFDCFSLTLPTPPPTHNKWKTHCHQMWNLKGNDPLKKLSVPILEFLGALLGCGGILSSELRSSQTGVVEPVGVGGMVDRRQADGRRGTRRSQQDWETEMKTEAEDGGGWRTEERWKGTLVSPFFSNLRVPVYSTNVYIFKKIKVNKPRWGQIYIYKYIYRKTNPNMSQQENPPLSPFRCLWPHGETYCTGESLCIYKCNTAVLEFTIFYSVIVVRCLYSNLLQNFVRKDSGLDI